jgi:hypothetical protein
VTRRTDSDLERSLSALRGLRTVRVELEDGEVHVFLVADETASASESDLVSQVRTVLRAERGLELPAERIHVARVMPSRTERTRVIFRSVHVYREGQRAEAQVELWDGERNRVGRSEGVAVRGGLVRLVAQATLDALRPSFGGQVAIELAAAQRKRIGARSFVLCHLVLVTGREERHLSGSVLVTTDSFEATVFSILDALNRVIPEQKAEEEIEYEVEDILPFHQDGERG